MKLKKVGRIDGGRALEVSEHMLRVRPNRAAKTAPAGNYSLSDGEWIACVEEDFWGHI